MRWSCLKISRQCQSLSSTTRCHLHGNQILDSCLSNHLRVGLLTFSTEFNSCQSGLKRDHPQLSGFLDSSSLKLSSRVRCRTTPESTQSPLISYRSNTRCTTKSNQMKLLKSQKTVASATECTWRVLDGTARVTTLMIPSQSNFTPTSH